jgi:hypothetical protein
VTDGSPISAETTLSEHTFDQVQTPFNHLPRRKRKKEKGGTEPLTGLISILRSLPRQSTFPSSSSTASSIPLALGSIEATDPNTFRSITPKPKLLPDGSATKKRLKEATPRKVSKAKGEGKETTATTGSTWDHMLENMCKNFMMLFLVGMDAISMSYAVHALIPMGEDETTEQYNKKYATKIRRVYDVANVLCSLNILQKKYVPRPPDATKGKKRAKYNVKVLVWASFKPLVVRDHFVRVAEANGYVPKDK